MAKPLTETDRIRGEFRRYLLKLACNKSDPVLNETEILKAFDLAVQKVKLSYLESELCEPKGQLKISKIDVSGDGPHECEKLLIEYHKALDKIASWSEGADVDKSFDEPNAATIARVALHYTRIAVNEG